MTQVISPMEWCSVGPMATTIDMTGRTYGRLTVLANYSPGKGKPRLVDCVCECGTRRTLNAEKVRNGNTSSCGCLRRERTRQQHNRRTHGLSKTPLYRHWKAMMKRCYDPTNIRYYRYGARGISVCQEWHDVLNYINYLEEVLGPKPSEDHSIDRINNDGNYEPGNIRWADRSTQMRNRAPYKRVKS